jgi:hypothetical protein
MKRKTKDEFIIDAISVHGKKYNYDQVNYINSSEKIKIFCNEHNIVFNISPKHHLNGQRCPECSSLKKNIVEFISQCIKKHSNKYNYSLVEYKNNKTIIKIICPKHGIFEQCAKDHLNGNGCNKCRSYTNSEFIEISNKIFNYKYDYSLVEYINNKTLVKIMCPIHGLFNQLPLNHLKGKGCLSCSKIRYTTDTFILKCREVHGDDYNYDKVKFENIKSHIIINCKKHGDFSQVPNTHLCGSGCPVCCSSKGEIKIKNYLESNSISYIKEYKFESCYNKYKLPFDFYLPDYNMCVEFDGRQHFMPVFGYKIEDKLNNLNKTTVNDNIKNQFCIINNIKLVRIKYDQNIEKILEDELCLK